jgi:RND family efflux transporter MFP subunit
VRIDPRDYEVQVKTLEAQLNVSRAQLNHAQAEYSRIRGLFEHDNVSRSDFDTAQSALDMAQGQVDATTQALKKAKLALDDTLLKAPYDGTVADTFVDSYQRVAPFQPVLLFQGQGGLKVVIQVPENEMSAWMAKRKDSFPVSFDVLPGLVVEAHVAEFSTENDPLTQTFAVSLELTPPIPESVIPGMTASVQWPQSNGESAFEKPVVVIPLTCIVTEASGNPYVWKFQKNDNTLIKQVVKTGDLTDSGIVILKGLNPGDQILAAGIHFAFEGQTVRPMEE